MGLMIATVWFVYIQMIPYEIISGEKAPDLPTLFLSVAFEPHNIKWFLVAIILTVSCFCLIFSSLNLQQADGALKKMQLFLRLLV
jgi:PiT family inorganic phosphate transporter